MSPASLYTYFDSLDTLYTELIVRSYASLAEAVHRALGAFAEAPVGDRLLVGPLAYRRWALLHPGEFNLVFSDQIPGYAAEPGGPTVDAQVAVFAPIVSTIREVEGTSNDADDLESFVGLWGAMHGLVSLEVNHHLDWLDAGQVFEREMRSQLAARALPRAAPDLIWRFAGWVP
jgi:AcrR family transcriptional regulator